MIPIPENRASLEHRPRLTASSPMRLAIRAAAPLLRPLLAARQRAKMQRVAEILADVNRCASRADLETVLGRPAYVLDGRLYHSTDATGHMTCPDQVEVYAVAGCTIDVWFSIQEGMLTACGCPSPTAADVLLDGRQR